MPTFSGLTTRNGSYDVEIPDSFTEKRVNRVLEIAKEYYSKLDRVLESINSHLHFAGGKGRFSYHGKVVADLDASGNLKIYATSKITYGVVEIVVKKNVLGTRSELFVSSIEEPKEVMIALYYLLKGMKVSESDVVAISSSLLAIATIREGLNQSFTPDLQMTIQRAGKIIGGEYSASFKFIDGNDVVIQKSDFSGEHIETVRDYYIKALSTIVAYLVQKGRFSTEALYALLSYYNSERRFLNVLYLRGLITSIDVSKAKIRYKWQDSAYEVLGNTLSFPIKKAVTVKWPEIKKVEVEPPVKKPQKKSIMTQTMTPEVAQKTELPIRKSVDVQRLQRPTVKHDKKEVVMKHDKREVVEKGNILLVADEIEKEIIQKRNEEKKQIEKPKQTKPKKEYAPTKKTDQRVVGVKSPSEQPEEQLKKEEKHKSKTRELLEKGRPAELDNWTIVSEVKAERGDADRKLLDAMKNVPNTVEGVRNWVKKVSESCSFNSPVGSKLCKYLTLLYDRLGDDSINGLSEAVKTFESAINSLSTLNTSKSRQAISYLERAKRVVERELKRKIIEEERKIKEEERKRELEKKLTSDYLEEVKNLITSAIRVVSTASWEKPGVKPLSKLIKRVERENSKLKSHGIDKYDALTSTIREFVDALIEACSKYPRVSPSDYSTIDVVHPEIEEEFKVFRSELEKLSGIAKKLTEYEEIKADAERLCSTIEKVAKKFEVSSAKIRSKVKSYVNSKITDTYIEASKIKVVPPIMVKVSNSTAIESVDKLIGSLTEVEERVKRSRVKDKQELIEKLQNVRKELELLREIIAKVSELPPITDKESAEKGINLAVELLKSTPKKLPFKPVRSALRKYLRTAGKKVGRVVSGEEVTEVDWSKVRLSIPLNKCDECPEVISYLEELLKGKLDRETRKMVYATLKVAKLFDEYPLSLVFNLRSKPEKLERFNGRLKKTLETKENLPKHIREVLEDYVSKVKRTNDKVDTKIKTSRNPKVSVKTKINSIIVPVPAKKRSYDSVKDNLSSIKEEIISLVEKGQLKEPDAKQFLSQIKEIERVVSIFENYPLDSPNVSEAIKSLEEVNRNALPSRVVRSVESYLRMASKHTQEVKISIRKRSVKESDDVYEKAIRYVSHLKADDLVNLRFERVNGIMKAIAKYTNTSERIARIYSDLDVVSRVLREANEKGVRKLLSITPVINTNQILIERMKKDGSIITEHKLTNIFVRIETSKNDLEVLKKVLETIKNVVSEKEVLVKVDEAISKVDEEIEKANKMEAEVEELAKSLGVDEKVKADAEMKIEERSGKRGVIGKIIGGILGTVLSILGGEDDKIPDNVSDYPEYIKEALSSINTKEVFMELRDISQEVGKLRVMASKYKEETGKETSYENKIEAMTKFALAIKDIREATEFKPKDILEAVRAVEPITQIKVDNLILLLGKNNLYELLNFLRNIKKDANEIVSSMEEVITYGKRVGFVPISENIIREVANASKRLDKVEKHVEKAIDRKFSNVDIQIEVNVPSTSKTVEIKLSKVGKDVRVAEKKVEKKAKSLIEDLKINADESLVEMITDIETAKKIGLLPKINKLRALSRGIIANVHTHNSAVDVARKEYESNGYLSPATVSKLKQSANRIVSSCKSVLSITGALHDEIKAKADEYNKRMREKAKEEKERKLKKDKPKKDKNAISNVVGQTMVGIKKVASVVSLSYDEVHPDKLLDEISSLEEEVEKILTDAERVVKKLEKIEEEETASSVKSSVNIKLSGDKNNKKPRKTPTFSWGRSYYGYPKSRNKRSKTTTPLWTTF